jgi:putative hydrolase of the HAD superfamily
MTMKISTAITCVFLDIGGGVLLTDGWDHHARKRAASHFKLEWSEMEGRHHLFWRTLGLRAKK